MGWTLSDGSAVNATGTHETEGGSLEPIPANTQCLCFIDEAKWDEIPGEAEYVKIRWRVLKPEKYQNRVVFQKLWVYDSNPNAKDAEKAAAQRDRAITQLANIDKNAGGGLQQSASALTPTDLTDELLAKHLLNKQMLVTFQVWEIQKDDGTTATGNWVSKIEPKGSAAVAATPKPKPKPKAKPVADMDDEIPF